MARLWRGGIPCTRSIRVTWNLAVRPVVGGRDDTCSLLRIRPKALTHSHAPNVLTAGEGTQAVIT